jgi:hypothetical protein
VAVAVSALAIGPRDLRIVTAARAKLGTHVDFGDAVRALREAVEEQIVDGRIYALGDGVIGSLVSGVGIALRASGILLVRGSAVLGRFG